MSAENNIRLATFDEYRSLLFSIAYRMLGRVSDAEDMPQETFIRWQQSDEDNMKFPRASLVSIVSRLCINQLQSARVQREEYVGQRLPEPIVTDPASEPFGIIKVDESISTVFLVLLERLTPIERAVFLLREVFEYEYAEVASILGQSEVNCRQILRRARQHVSAMRPRFVATQQKQNDLFGRFLNAPRRGEMKGLFELLSKDVVLHSDGGGKGIAVPNIVRGSDNVARGILGSLKRFVPINLVRRFALVNGEPGLVSYFDGKPHSVLTIDVSDGQIQTTYIVTNPEKLSHIPAPSGQTHRCSRPPCSRIRKAQGMGIRRNRHYCPECLLHPLQLRRWLVGFGATGHFCRSRDFLPDTASQPQTARSIRRFSPTLCCFNSKN